MIAIDARYVRERPSGIGAMVDALVRMVPRLMPDQKFLLLRHPLARNRLSDQPNVREITVQAEANGPTSMWMLPRLIDLSRVRLFHSPFNTLPAGLGMKTVTTIHDLMWLQQPELCRSRGLWGHVETAFYAHGLRRALHRSDRLIAISHATLAAIGRADRRAAARTTVVQHGIDPAFGASQTQSDAAACDRVRGRYAPGASRYVMAVGRSAPYKNHRKVVEAFVLALGDDPGAHLVLVQRLGTEAQELVGLARAAGAADRVHVHPAIDQTDLIALYRGALCLCQPSIVEGWGMPAAEAMGCGCPVVASDCDALREVLGPAAQYVDARSTISIAGGLRKMASDPEARARLIKTGLTRAAEFRWAETARGTVQVYDKCLRS